MTTAVKEQATKQSVRPSAFEVKAKAAVLPRRGELTIEDLAEVFNVTVSTIRSWISKGFLPRAKNAEQRGRSRSHYWLTCHIREVLENNGNRRYRPKQEATDDSASL